MTICPECGSDQVVQLAGQPHPYSSTPINNSLIQDSEVGLLINHSLQGSSKVSDTLLLCGRPSSTILKELFLCRGLQGDGTDGSISGSSVPEAGAASEDPTFMTAQGSSFFIGDAQGDVSSVSSNADSQSKEGLFGSYCYTATPPEFHAPPAGRSTPCGELERRFRRRKPEPPARESQ